MKPTSDHTRDTDTRFTLRMNTELFEELKKSADKNKRSVTREIEYIIENWLKQNQ